MIILFSYHTDELKTLFFHHYIKQISNKQAITNFDALHFLFSSKKMEIETNVSSIALNTSIFSE